MENAILNRLVLVLLFVSFTACQPKTSICKIEEIKRLYSVRTINNNSDTDYVHHVLLKGFSRECMDSITMVSIAIKYIDTITEGKLASMISFYNSTDNFDLNETSQVSKVFEDCLVQIDIDRLTKKPTNFSFYNNYGDNIYRGDKWNPNGEKSKNHAR